jgi:tetratricopeptide (TPR) repeat protein
MERNKDMFRRDKQGWIALLIAAALFVTAPITAFADGDQAKKHYERALKKYNLQDFSTALEEFKAAYEEKPDPAFLFNIAQCQRQLGQYDAAAKSYRAFLNQSPDAANRPEVGRLIDEMDRAAKEVRSKQPPTGVSPPSPSPLDRQREAVTTPQLPEHRESSTTPQQIPMERRPSRPMIVGGVVAAGIGVAAMATGIAFGVLAKNAGDTLTKNDNARLPFDNATYQAGQRDQILEGVFIGIGAAALVVGGTIAVLGSRRRVPSRAAIAPTVNGLAVRF